MGIEVKYAPVEGSGTKYDNGKPRFDLIPVMAMGKVAEVCGYGANKYDDRNWEGGISYGRVWAALQRHLWKFWRKEEYDEESKLHHLAHAAWGCLVLLEYELTGKTNDSRSELYDKEEDSNIGDEQIELQQGPEYHI